jgi:predicted  nucleic acid-binding Zn-ribbon protein
LSKTKEEIVAQVKKNTWAIKSLNNKTEDINALWHWCKCLEETNNKLKKELQQLHEEINKVNTKTYK